MWILFWDMHSGGYIKQKPFRNIIIEADSLEEGIEKFITTFGHDPRDIACDCCGDNYAISTSDTLAELLDYHMRGVTFSVDEFLAFPHVKIIYESKIKENADITIGLKRNVKV